MIGIVIVSHSPALARAAVDLALEMVHGEIPELRITAGIEGRYGTDAGAVAAAIDSLVKTDGVLVITDLGSAVLSAGLALDLRQSTVETVVSSGPFVEGLTAGIVLAATGAPLDAVAAEVSTALRSKIAQSPALIPSPVIPPARTESADVAASSPASAEDILRNPDGLHARPAAVIVRTTGAFDAHIEVTNITKTIGPVSAASLVGLLSLGGRPGDIIRFDGTGPDAAPAVTALHTLLIDGFGELTPH